MVRLGCVIKRCWLVFGCSSGPKIFRYYFFVFFFQAEDGIRVAQESRGLGDVYKRQGHAVVGHLAGAVVPVDDGQLAGQPFSGLGLAALTLSLIHI